MKIKTILILIFSLLIIPFTFGLKDFGESCFYDSECESDYCFKYFGDFSQGVCNWGESNEVITHPVPDNIYYVNRYCYFNQHSSEATFIQMKRTQSCEDVGMYSDFKPTAVCGNGKIEDIEDCEKGDTKSCKYLNYVLFPGQNVWSGGTASCDSSCLWDTRSCVSYGLKQCSEIPKAYCQNKLIPAKIGYYKNFDIGGCKDSQVCIVPNDGEILPDPIPEYTCPNDICESTKGETADNCPQDCTVPKYDTKYTKWIIVGLLIVLFIYLIKKRR